MSRKNIFKNIPSKAMCIQSDGINTVLFQKKKGEETQESKHGKHNLNTPDVTEIPGTMRITYDLFR